jgi:hypothetical protein
MKLLKLHIFYWKEALYDFIDVIEVLEIASVIGQ